MRQKRYYFGVMCILLLLLLQVMQIQTQAAQVKLNKTKATIYVKNTVQLKVIGTSQEVTWKSSNENVATVDNDGLVMAEGEGTATITASVKNKKYKCKITVKTPVLNKSYVQLKQGKTVKLKLMGEKVISWDSSDEFVATVNPKGKVTANEMGIARITAMTCFGSYSCYISVYIPYGQHKCKYEKIVSEDICGTVRQCCFCGKVREKIQGHKYVVTKNKKSENDEYSYKSYKCKKCRRKYSEHNVGIGIKLVSRNNNENIFYEEVTMYPGEKAKIQIGTFNKKISSYIKIKLAGEGSKYLKLSKDGYITYKSNKALNQEQDLSVYFDVTVTGDPKNIDVDVSNQISICLPGKKQMQVRKKEKEVINQVIEKNMTDAEKVLAIHDWMCRNVRYDYENLKKIEAGIELSESERECYSAIGVMLKGKAVCSGYTDAFYDFMELLNIPCEGASSDIMNHAWNQVKLEGEWYWIDNTWDACVTPCHMSLSYKWFLRNGKREKDEIGGVDSCTGVKMRYKVFEKYRVDSEEDIKAQLRAQLNQDYMYLAVYDKNFYYNTVQKVYEKLYDKPDSGYFYPDIEEGPIKGTNYNFFTIVIIEKTDRVRQYLDGMMFEDDGEYFWYDEEQEECASVLPVTGEVPIIRQLPVTREVPAM